MEAMPAGLPVRPWCDPRPLRIVAGVTRPPQRRAREPVPEDERGEAAVAPAPHAVLDLQRGAGNAAVARALAAREPTQLVKPPPVTLGPNPQLWGKPLPADVEQAVDAYLTEHKAGFLREALDGRLSLPEVVDQVRRNVPAAADASPLSIEARVGLMVGAVPSKRTKRDLAGQNVEYAARIANLLPKPPTSVTIGASQTSLTVRLVEAELKTAKDGVHGSVKADKDGGEAEVKKGDVKAGVSGKWDGSSFGVKTEVGVVKFGGKVERKGDGWKWSGGLVFRLAGDEVDELPDVGGVVASAHSALADSLAFVRDGGAPTDPYVTGRMGQIKPAIDALGKVAQRSGKSGATLRVTASGDDGGFTAGVSLVVVF
jgi:hypothetical protein